MNVKYHSNQKTTDQYIAENVSKSINHRNVVAVLAMVEEVAMVEDLAMAEDPDLAETIDQEKCSRQHAGIVAMNVKYHSNQKTIDQYIAENVSKTTNKTRKTVLSNSQNYKILSKQEIKIYIK